MELRPHHLLCTRAFKGFGYSPAFVQNMYEVISALKTEQTVTLIEGCDSICSQCPKRRNNCCLAEDKVSALDTRALEYLQLERTSYSYYEIEQKIETLFTPDVYQAICRSCEWYTSGVCCYADTVRPL